MEGSQEPTPGLPLRAGLIPIAEARVIDIPNDYDSCTADHETAVFLRCRVLRGACLRLKLGEVALDDLRATIL